MCVSATRKFTSRLFGWLMTHFKLPYKNAASMRYRGELLILLKYARASYFFLSFLHAASHKW